jgi:hypothetical protein
MQILSATGLRTGPGEDFRGVAGCGIHCSAIATSGHFLRGTAQRGEEPERDRSHGGLGAGGGSGRSRARAVTSAMIRGREWGHRVVAHRSHADRLAKFLGLGD